MTDDQAKALVVRYKNIWRGGPTSDELRQHFAEMDWNRARSAMNRLAQRLENPPSIATIWREHEATRGNELRRAMRDVLPDYSNAVGIEDAIAALGDDPAAATLARYRRTIHVTPDA